MKKITIKLLALFLTFVVVSGCQKDEVEEPDLPIVELDNSLIIANSGTGKYVIVSPTSGAVKAEVQPNVKSLTDWALGYMSQKAILLSKEPGGSFVKVIYTCDRETGSNIFQVTSEQDWDVLAMDGSPTGPHIAFAAQDVNMLSDDNIHRINEDGSSYQQLTFKDEGIDCPPSKIAMKLVAAYDPAWSPAGNSIAFDGHLRELDNTNPHNVIIIMDANGGNKQVVYDVPMEETHYKDICWTRDGKFLIFLVTEGTEVKAKALNVNTKVIVDFTNHIKVDGLHPESLWTSPNENKIAFNKYQPGGGDLYVIDFIVTETDQFMISGSYKLLSAAQGKGMGFGGPDWQLFPPAQ